MAKYLELYDHAVELGCEVNLAPCCAYVDIYGCYCVLGMIACGSAGRRLKAGEIGEELTKLGLFGEDATHCALRRYANSRFEIEKIPGREVAAEMDLAPALRED